MAASRSGGGTIALGSMRENRAHGADTWRLAAYVLVRSRLRSRADASGIWPVRPRAGGKVASSDKVNAATTSQKSTKREGRNQNLSVVMGSPFRNRERRGFARWDDPRQRPLRPGW